MKVYYAVEGAFYTASVFMLLFWEERRKDFNAMLLHHIATSLLIAVSWFFSCAPSSASPLQPDGAFDHVQMAHWQWDGNHVCMHRLIAQQ